PPLGPCGRPTPPPPGWGGGRPTAAPSGPRPGGSYPPRTGGRPSGAGRPGGGPSTGGGFGGRPSGGGFGGRSGAGAPAGAPPQGGRGGMPGRRPPQRRARRRRRNLEELEPTQLTTYQPSTAPVPEGEVIVERGSTARDLGPRLNRSAGDIVRFLLLQGEMIMATQSLSDDMIELFAAEIGANVRLVDPGEEQEAELLARYFEEEDEEDEADQRPRPPVVTVMGHVDHGKTLLLDRIRSTDVVAGEAGGITQHIGAYQVEWQGHRITFIDTPGHAAFTAMRARGAQVTDIVILVVAADDGVMPQTIEAIDHAKAADVPIIVAVNKMDRPDADPQRVLQQLSERELVPEAWGGDTIVVEVSALQGAGIDDLLEQIVLVAEVEELTARVEGEARGVVLEANLEAGRGPVATVIVQQGTLRVGDPVVAGAAWGKVKALVDDRGDHIKEALPSTPVQVLGFSEPPHAGDEMRAAKDLARARTLGEARAQRFRLSGHKPVAAATGAKLEDLFEQISRGETATLNIVLKADVQGSLEAVTESLKRLERDDVKLSFVLRGIGGITENDVQLAAASNATIIGFNVRPDKRARDLAEASDVEIRTYEIIYKLLEDLEAAMLGLLSPVYEEVVTGEAEVREVFRVPRVGAVAGCYVREGKITRGSKVRFLREGTVIWKGSINSLRRFKDDVREVAAGFECGIGLSDFQDLKEGDVIETYEEREIART
ncbi:MAG: translation initiation factor IF-2, partial [Acidimicrobiales bacterium]